MLLYEYPPKLDRHGKQLKAAHDIQEHKKMQKNMYRNLLLGGIIIILGCAVPVMIIKILVLLIGVGNMATAYLLYKYSAMSRDTKCYTRIYEDRLEHCQGSLITGNHTEITLLYDDIDRSYQDPSGKLVVCLKDGNSVKLVSEKKNKRAEKELKENKVTLDFQDTKAKLFLIDKLYDKIKYPKKNYNVIEDEDDEDDKWDPLHKHGL